MRAKSVKGSGNLANMACKIQYVPVKTAHGHSWSNKTKQNKTKQNKTKQNKTKQNKTKQNKTKQNKTKQNKTKRNKKNIPQHKNLIKQTNYMQSYCTVLYSKEVTKSTYCVFCSLTERCVNELNTGILISNPNR